MELAARLWHAPAHAGVLHDGWLTTVTSFIVWLPALRDISRRGRAVDCWLTGVWVLDIFTKVVVPRCSCQPATSLKTYQSTNQKTYEGIEAHPARR